MPKRTEYHYENVDNDNSWDTWETMLEWRDIWLKAIALAWTDKQFKEALLKNARTALVDYFDYSLPQQLDFHVVDVTDAKATYSFQYPPPGSKVSKSGYGWYSVRKTKHGSEPIERIKNRADFDAQLKKPGPLWTQWELPKSLLVYPLPPPPEDDIQAVAVADFSAAGRTYPFTTC
jgi:hypothetical protein